MHLYWLLRSNSCYLLCSFLHSSSNVIVLLWYRLEYIGTSACKHVHTQSQKKFIFMRDSWWLVRQPWKHQRQSKGTYAETSTLIQTRKAKVSSPCFLTTQKQNNESPINWNSISRVNTSSLTLWQDIALNCDYQMQKFSFLEAAILKRCHCFYWLSLSKKIAF